MVDSAIPYYQPWVGKNYFTNPFENTRLLLVGESSFQRDDHISQPDHLCADTQRIADGNLDFKPRYAGFWRFIQRALIGNREIRQESQQQFWNGVSLANWIQRPMSSKHARPTFEDYDFGSAALKSYIEQLKPNGVIVFSKLSWPSLTDSFGLMPTKQLLQNSATVPELVLASNQAYSPAAASGGPRFLLLRHPSSWPKTSGVSWNPLIAPMTNGLLTDDWAC